MREQNYTGENNVNSHNAQYLGSNLRNIINLSFMVGLIHNKKITEGELEGREENYCQF